MLFTHIFSLSDHKHLTHVTRLENRKHRAGAVPASGVRRCQCYCLSYTMAAATWAPVLLCRGHWDQAKHRPCHDRPEPANIATSQGEASDSFQHKCEGRKETFVKLHQNCVSCHHHLDAVKHCFKWMIWKGLTSTKPSSSSEMTLTWPPRNLNLTSTSPSVNS